MLLGALQDFEWYNEPENVVFRDKLMLVTAAAGSDFWQSRHHGVSKDNGHFFYCRKDGNFTLVAKWSYTQKIPYAQCGVMLRVDENNWIKATVMYDAPDKPMLGTGVTQNGYSDWAAQPITPDFDDIWFKVKRLNGDYLLYYSLDGEKFKSIRMTHLLNDMPEVKVGAYICSPQSADFEAVLSQIEFI